MNMKTFAFDERIKTLIEGIMNTLQIVADESRRAYGRQLAKDGEFILAAHERLAADNYRGDDFQRELDAECSGEKDCQDYLKGAIDFIRRTYMR